MSATETMAVERMASLLPSITGKASAPDVKPHQENLVIILPIPEPKPAIEAMRKNMPHFKITYRYLVFAPGQAREPDNIDPEVFKDCTILFTLSGLPPADKATYPNLKWMHLFSAGANTIVHHPIWKDDSILLTNSTGVHGPQIAEWFIMTLLAQTHFYNALYDQQKEHVWAQQSKKITRVQDMVGRKLGVLGYGSIGRQAARVGKAMGMEVYAYTATPKPTKESRKDNGYIVPGTGDPDGSLPTKWFSGLEREKVREFLKEGIDVLLISLPLTDDTKHIISTEELQILADNRAFISNVSRGPVIDQPALIEVLREGKLRGAALDVTDPEPLPADSPLWDMENVTITPHVSGIGEAYAHRCFAVFRENVRRKIRGERLLNVIDRKRGY